MVILLADDDPDDRMLIGLAFEDNNSSNELRCVGDGEELLEYLQRVGRYQQSDAPLPDLILLDLNMPRKDGREALREIRADATLRRIPIVIFSTSQSLLDINNAYDAGANSFITKPAGYNDLVEVMKRLELYWSETVRLPATY